MFKLILILALTVLLESADAININSNLPGNITFAGGNLTIVNQTFVGHFIEGTPGHEKTIVYTIPMAIIKFDPWTDPCDRARRNLSV